MKSIKNFLITFDIFGITYAFRYKDKEKYQTSLGGLVVIFFYDISNNSRYLLFYSFC